MASAELASAVNTAGAHVDIAVVIPPVLRILEDEHPASLLTPRPGVAVSATQHMVVISTLRKGFCVDMRVDTSHVSGWKLQVAGVAQANVQSLADGYRVCIAKAGRYELLLSHDFSLERGAGGDAGPGRAATAGWPVAMNFATP